MSPSSWRPDTSTGARPGWRPAWPLTSSRWVTSTTFSASEVLSVLEAGQDQGDFDGDRQVGVDGEEVDVDDVAAHRVALQLLHQRQVFLARRPSTGSALRGRRRALSARRSDGQSTDRAMRLHAHAVQDGGDLTLTAKSSRGTRYRAHDRSVLRAPGTWRCSPPTFRSPVRQTAVHCSGATGSGPSGGRGAADGTVGDVSSGCGRRRSRSPSCPRTRRGWRRR